MFNVYKKHDRSTGRTEVQVSMAVFQHLKSLSASVSAYLGIFESPQMNPWIKMDPWHERWHNVPEEMSPLP